MQVSNGRMADTGEFEKEMGKEELAKAIANKEIVPVPEETEKDKNLKEAQKYFKLMSHWGRKKRDRYAELLGVGMTTVDAFDVVENHKGVIPMRGPSGAET